MLDNEPELFQKAVDLENLLNERRKMLGKDPVWFTRFLKPLSEAILPTVDKGEQLSMFGEEVEEYSCGPYTCAGDGPKVELDKPTRLMV